MLKPFFQSSTQDRIPNRWKELLRNRLVKSLSHAAEKYFRKRMRRHQRNMPIAIEISDNSDEVQIFSWSLPSLSLWPSELFCITILTLFWSLYNTERDAPSCPCGHAGRRTWNWKWKWKCWNYQHFESCVAAPCPTLTFLPGIVRNPTLAGRMSSCWCRSKKMELVNVHHHPKNRVET